MKFTLLALMLVASSLGFAQTYSGDQITQLSIQNGSAKLLLKSGQEIVMNVSEPKAVVKDPLQKSICDRIKAGEHITIDNQDGFLYKEMDCDNAEQ